jgi:hypothetical protein
MQQLEQLEERPVKHGPVLREARRRSNRKQSVGDLRCECGEASCRSPIPATAAAHRGLRDGFIVVPGHHGQDVVVAAADRFFVVELARGRPS